MASRKRKYEDEDEADDGGSGRKARVRKKSAKVLEMEEAEELEKLERKNWNKASKGGSKKSPTKSKISLLKPGSLPPGSVMLSSIPIKEDPDDILRVCTEHSPIRMKLNTSGEKITKKKAVKVEFDTDISIKEEKLPDLGSSPLTMKFVMSPGQQVKIEDSMKNELPPPPPSSAKKKKESETVKKKKVKSPAAAPMTKAPELLAALAAAKNPSEQPESIKTEIKREDSDDDLDDGDPELLCIDHQDDEEYMEESDHEAELEPSHYVNTTQMAQKVQTHAEKKAGKGKKKDKKQDDSQKQPKKKRGPTAYMLWCNHRRPKLVEEDPKMDFGTISKKLGEIWQTIPEKEKMTWRRKAKKAGNKGSAMINTGKQRGSILLNKTTPGGVTVATQQAIANARQVAASAAASTSSSRQVAGGQSLHMEDVSSMAAFKLGARCTAMDAAAHLKLLGESLSIIGARLQESQGKIAVQGSMSVLLDSLICALGPLTALTNQIPELDGAPSAVHNATLDNIAYLMPGIG